MKTLALTLLCAPALASLSLASVAHAGPVESGRWAVSGSIGTEVPVSGDVHGGTTTGQIPLATIASLRDAGAPALPAALTATGNAGQLRIQSRGFDDIYDNATALSFEATYGIGKGRELFGSFDYVKADEGSTQVGTAAVVNGSNTVAEVPVFGRFGEYKGMGVSVGARQWFNEGGTFEPFIAGRIGVSKIDEIRATFTIPDLTINQSLRNVPFYDDTTIVTAGVEAGISYKMSENVSLIAETGLRYYGKLDGNDSAIGGLGLASINEEGNRLVVPVTLKLRAVF